MNLHKLPKGLIPIEIQGIKEISYECIKDIVYRYPALEFLNHSSAWRREEEVSWVKRLDKAYYLNYKKAIPEDIKQGAARMATESLVKQRTSYLKFWRKFPPYDPFSSCWNIPSHESYESKIAYFERQKGHAICIYKDADSYPKSIASRVFMMPFDAEDLYLLHNFKGRNSCAFLRSIMSTLNCKYSAEVRVNVVTEGYIDSGDVYAIGKRPISNMRLELSLR